MSSESSFNFISKEGIYILNTQNSTSLTAGGCITILGGASINKDVLIGGSLIFPNQNNFTLNPNDLLSTINFTAGQKITSMKSKSNIAIFIGLQFGDIRFGFH